MTPFLLALLPVGLGVILWAMVDLQRFVMFGIMGTIMFPNTIFQRGGGQVAAADLLLLVALAAWVVRNAIGADPDPRVTHNPLLLPAILFVSVATASVAWSSAPGASLFFAIQVAWITIVTTVVFASLPRDIKTIRRGLFLYLAITSAMALYAVVSVVPELSAGELEGAFILGLNKNALGSFLAAGLVIAYVHWLVTPRILNVFLVPMVVEAVGLAASVSRGSVLGAAVALIACSLLLRTYRVVTILAVSLATVGFILGVGIQASKKKDVAGAYDSSLVRIYAWPRAVDKIRARPLLGTGGATYHDYLAELHLPITDANNMILQTAAELGLAGLAALLFLLYRFGRLWGAAARLRPEARTLAVAAGGVALAALAHNLVDITWIRGQTSIAFVMMGLLVAISGRAAPDRPGVAT